MRSVVTCACQADFDSKLFSLSDVNFTCPVIILIFITPCPFLFFPPLELITCSRYVPLDFPEVIVGDSDWKGGGARVS